MKLTAFDPICIEYRDLMAIDKLKVAWRHECNCEYCEENFHPCPYCEEDNPDLLTQ